MVVIGKSVKVPVFFLSTVDFNPFYNFRSKLRYSHIEEQILCYFLFTVNISHFANSPIRNNRTSWSNFSA